MDARKSLDVLYDEWATCQKCSLGIQRMSVNGQFVFGEGIPRGILFVGEGPGKTEEKEGRPFVGVSGKLFRSVLDIFKFDQYFITNVVACRSCEALTNPDGSPMMRRYGNKTPQLVYRDQPPNPIQIKACLPRLHETIYLVDPVLIVSLGGTAAEVLTGKAVSISIERGKERHITIPGATTRASLTDKKKVWIRKSGGHLIAPTEQNEVRYLLLPTLHPAFVSRRIDDRGPRGPIRQFASDIRKAIKIYERYMLEIFGVVISNPQSNVSDEQVEETVVQATNEEEEFHGQ